VQLARELWNFDAVHARLAKDLDRYLRGIEVEDPVSLAQYLESKMSAMEMDEARKKWRSEAKSKAEAARRAGTEAKRDAMAEKQDQRIKGATARAAAQQRDLEKKRDAQLKREEELCERRRGVEEKRREEAHRVLVVAEEERVREVDESARAREVRRREALHARQEREHQEDVAKDELKRREKTEREAKDRMRQEIMDPQVIRGDKENPHRMKGYSRQIAPYAMQQRPMGSRLNRWRHNDIVEDHTTAKPLSSEAFRLQSAERKELRPYDGVARARDDGHFVSMRWVEDRGTRPW